jgi:hypothetical protein
MQNIFFQLVLAMDTEEFTLDNGKRGWWTSKMDVDQSGMDASVRDVSTGAFSRVL